MRRREFISGLAASTAALGMSGCTTAGDTGKAYSPLAPPRQRQLVAAAHFGPKEAASGSNGLAVSTHPLVSQAAVDVLEEGGNAVDAICTASLTQTVVEPHMTTLTGVFSMQYYEAKTGRVRYLNASNNAPKHFPVDMGGMSELMAMLADGRGVTVPGFWAGVEAAMAEYGTVTLKRALAPGIEYARDGFETHPFLWGEIFVSMDKIGGDPQGREIYLPNNFIPRPGEVLYQKRAGDLLQRLAEEGSDYFYHGGFAEKFSEKVQAAGGWITPEDFAAYQVKWQDPVRSSYRGYEIAAAPDPDFGGVVFAEIMNMVEQMDVQSTGPAWDSGETAFKLMQIIARVGVDNVMNAYAGKTLSMEQRVSKAYAEQRFAALGDARPANITEAMQGAPVPPPGSNHLTVVDAQGNVATVLHSCMSFPWSNGMFVDGISICAAGSHYGSGLPAPGGRINARIGPHMFLREGKCVLAGGSPSISLQENITQNAINLLDFGMSVEESVNKPRFGGSSMSKPGAILVEADMPQELIARLEKSGGKADVVNPWNWSHGSYDSIAIDPASGVASACGDPRRTAMAIAV